MHCDAAILMSDVSLPYLLCRSLLFVFWLGCVDSSLLYILSESTHRVSSAPDHAPDTSTLVVERAAVLRVDISHLGEVLPEVAAASFSLVPGRGDHIHQIGDTVFALLEIRLQPVFAELQTGRRDDTYRLRPVCHCSLALAIGSDGAARRSRSGTSRLCCDCWGLRERRSGRSDHVVRDSGVEIGNGLEDDVQR